MLKCETTFSVCLLFAVRGGAINTSATGRKAEPTGQRLLTLALDGTASVYSNYTVVDGMGTALSRHFARLWNRNDRRMLLVGLDAAGKTTILYNLRLGKAISSIPTVGFNVETVKHERYKLHIWDVGGQDSLRPYWRHHFTGTQGIIFVIDSADAERLVLAKAELDGVLMDSQLNDASLLVFLNKRDLPGVITVDELVTTLDLEKSCQQCNRKFLVQPAVATTGEGLREGLTWLCENMTEL